MARKTHTSRILLLFVVLTISNQIYVSAVPTPPSNTTILKGPPAQKGWVRISGTKFTLDGCLFYFHGTNIYYLNVGSRDLVVGSLDSAKRAGLNVIRTWAFVDQPSDGIQYQGFDGKDTVIYDGPKGLGQLDMVIAEAKKRNMKVIPALTNNWDAYGGMDMYNDWFGGKYHDDFYTGKKQREAYQKYVSAVLNRVNKLTGVAYKDEPTIMAWELANEPRCRSSRYQPSPNCKAEIITSWVRDMSKYVKTIDTNHLIALGDEGFAVNADFPWYPFKAGYEGVDFEPNLAIPDIDFGTFHLYPDHWGITRQDETKFSQAFIKWHADIGKKLNKPVLLEEYGYHDENREKEMFDMWHKSSQENDLAGTLFW
ncbi:glycoside hydrolase superfamily [Paraphysoderma sedebokerense]|nr:glycoside hydrolase superfamily [Paraphysoderma sedebokerense]